MPAEIFREFEEMPSMKAAGCKRDSSSNFPGIDVLKCNCDKSRIRFDFPTLNFYLGLQDGQPKREGDKQNGHEFELEPEEYMIIEKDGRDPLQ